MNKTESIDLQVNNTLTVVEIPKEGVVLITIPNGATFLTYIGKNGIRSIEKLS